jgi:two-component system, OmpR family, response regulator
VPNQQPICLIVDDEPDTCWALEHVLRKQGLRTRRALSAEHALREVQQRPYTLTLLDAKLPDMDGLELARRIRAIDPGILIIVVSGYFYQDAPTIQEAQASQLIQDFVAKPFQHEEITRAVRKALAAQADGRGEP